MSTDSLEEIIKRAEALTPDEQLRLVEQLMEKVRDAHPSSRPRRQWREIRGVARYPLLDEDAQEWVSRTRRESDER